MTTEAASGPAQWLDLTGKVALVTGGGRGIGAGIVRVLAQAGASVVVGDIEEAAARASAERAGGSALVLDVADPTSVEHGFERLLAEAGRIDVLINNAGIYRGHGGPIETLSHQQWRRLMAVNLDGLFYCSQIACRAMVARGGGGRIVNIASTQSFVPGVGVTYDSSKAAVLGFTRTLALEMAPHGITVNAVAPGATWVGDGPAPATGGHPTAPTGEPLADTVTDRIRRIPLGRWGTPDEIGRAVLFFASAMSEYVTGTCLLVDGGWLLL